MEPLPIQKLVMVTTGLILVICGTLLALIAKDQMTQSSRAGLGCLALLAIMIGGGLAIAAAMQP